jgi:rhodanese-related sulfurtransferase
MSVPEVDVDELARRLAAGASVIDVREPHEYVAGHVAGAVSIPLASVPERIEEFRRTGPTYVICQAGGRSRRAAEFVTAHGIEAVNVAGGTGEWIASGRDVVEGAQPG